MKTLFPDDEEVTTTCSVCCACSFLYVLAVGSEPSTNPVQAASYPSDEDRAARQRLRDEEDRADAELIIRY